MGSIFSKSQSHPQPQSIVENGAFAEADQNNDNSVSREEFEEWKEKLNKRYTKLKAVQDTRADELQSQIVSRDEEIVKKDKIITDLQSNIKLIKQEYTQECDQLEAEIALSKEIINSLRAELEKYGGRNEPHPESFYSDDIIQQQVEAELASEANLGLVPDFIERKLRTDFRKKTFAQIKTVLDGISISLDGHEVRMYMRPKPVQNPQDKKDTPSPKVLHNE